MGIVPTQENTRKEVDHDDMLHFIKHFHGNLSRIASTLGIARRQVKQLIAQDEELTFALQDEEEARIDLLEEMIWSRVHDLALDNQLVIFLLKTKGRSRGYETGEVQVQKDLAQAALKFILDRDWETHLGIVTGKHDA